MIIVYLEFAFPPSMFSFWQFFLSSFADSFTHGGLQFKAVFLGFKGATMLIVACNFELNSSTREWTDVECTCGGNRPKCSLKFSATSAVRYPLFRVN